MLYTTTNMLWAGRQASCFYKSSNVLLTFWDIYYFFYLNTHLHAVLYFILNVYYTHDLDCDTDLPQFEYVALTQQFRLVSLTSLTPTYDVRWSFERSVQHTVDCIAS